MLKKTKRRLRAQRRREARTVENQLARGLAASVSPEPQKRPERARHTAVIDTLHARRSISDQQLRAAVRLAIDFRSSGSVIGQLVAAYAPRFKSKIKYQPTPDVPHVLQARERTERALAAVSPLADPLISVCVFDEAPARWAMSNGFQGPDGAGAIRIGLTALADHYAGRSPLRMRVTPPDVKNFSDQAPCTHMRTAKVARESSLATNGGSAVSDQSPALTRNGEPAVSRQSPSAASYRDFLAAQTQGAMVDDATLRAALAYAEHRGLLNGTGDAEMRRVAAGLAQLARDRWVGSR